MNRQQLRAIANPTFLACETSHPQFMRRTRHGSVILTVNAGYE